MLRERQDIDRAFSQWWQRDCDDVEPVKQILSERTFVDRLFEIDVGRRDYPHIHVTPSSIADGREVPLLNDSQKLSLRLDGYVSDFIKEDRAAVGDFKVSFSRRDG